MDCPCKAAMGAPQSEISSSCIAVGEYYARFWMENCRKYNPCVISQEEALEITKSFRRKKHLSQIFFKVATGGSSGVVCTCHTDTCVSLMATKLARKFDHSLSQSAESEYSVSCNFIGLHCSTDGVLRYYCIND